MGEEEFYTNCSKCKKGIIEPLFVLDLTPGEFKTSYYRPYESLDKQNQGIIVLICSNDYCGHTTFYATPGTLSSAKLKLKESLYNKQKEVSYK